MLIVVLAAVATGCSEDAFGDLGERSAGWFQEVSTTIPATTTTAPALTRPISDVTWVNDDFTMAPGLDEEAVLSAVYARSGGDSQFLQASRREISVVTPGILFPTTVPMDVGYVTSQIVIEAGALRLSTDPTVAFGLWSVEPYTRSRSVGQVAVLNVATDPGGAEVAGEEDVEPTCARFAGATSNLCSIETIGGTTTWRLENDSGVTYVFFDDPYRYELFVRPGVAEQVTQTMLASIEPLGGADSAAAADAGTPDADQ